MADEIANYLSTPEGYATPDQLTAVRSYAKALLQGEGQQPVQHWAQGVSNMVNALLGGLLVNKAAERELGSRGYDAKNIQANIPKQNYRQAEVAPSPMAPGAPVRKMSAEGDMPKAIPASAPGDDLLAPQKAGIASAESGGGNYSLIGPMVKKGAYAGDHAYGKYQVMGRNIPEWTQEALGRPMTPQEFLKDKAAQEKVFEVKFGQLRKKYGNDQDAASAWFSGRPLDKGGREASDGFHNGEWYQQQFAKGMKKAAPTAAAFAGEPTPSQAPAVQAMAAALRGGSGEAPAQVKQVAGKGGAAAPGAVTPVGPQSGPPPVINPGLVKPPPEYNQQELGAILQSPWVPQEVKDRAYGQALQQGQAIRMPVPGGSVLIDPRNPKVQQFIPDVHWGTRKVGPIETQVPQVVSPYGGGGVMTLPNMGPRSDAGPTAAPAAAPQGTPPATPASAVAAAQNAPAGATGPANGVQVASLDPAAGVAQAAAQEAQAGAAPDGTPVVKTAEVGTDQPSMRDQRLQALMNPPPGISKDEADALRFLEEQKAQVELDKGRRAEAGKLAVTRYNDAVKNSEVIPEQLNNIALAKQMMNDPNFNSGMASGIKDVWNRFRELALGEKNANLSNETFDKLMASQVLQSMRGTLQGLGQVRLAEINLLNQANANRHNTVASNRAVLEITERNLMKHQKLMEMANDYVAGNDVTDPVTGKVLLKADPNREGSGLDAGWNKLAKSWSEANPAFNPDEIKSYQKVLTTGKNPDGTDSIANPQPGKDNPASGNFKTPDASDIKLLQDGKVSRQTFEKYFGPADKYLAQPAAKPEPPISR